VIESVVIFVLFFFKKERNHVDGIGYRRRRMDKHNKGDEKISRHTYFFFFVFCNFEMKHDCLIHGGNTHNTQKKGERRPPSLKISKQDYLLFTIQSKKTKKRWVGTEIY
jgi:hypothetical protein